MIKPSDSVKTNRLRRINKLFQVQYLDKKGQLFSVLFANMLDNAKLIQFLLEESKTIKQLINNKENFDNEMSLKLDELYKKFINPDSGFYHNYGLNNNEPEPIININPNNNQLDNSTNNIVTKV